MRSRKKRVIGKEKIKNSRCQKKTREIRKYVNEQRGK